MKKKLPYKVRLWVGDSLIMLSVFTVIGLVIAFTTPKVYKSSVVLAPEETEQGFSGSVSSLASMIGMNMKLLSK